MTSRKVDMELWLKLGKCISLTEESILLSAGDNAKNFFFLVTNVPK
jgi:hypothetical protein